MSSLKQATEERRVALSGKDPQLVRLLDQQSLTHKAHRLFWRISLLDFPLARAHSLAADRALFLSRGEGTWL